MERRSAGVERTKAWVCCRGEPPGWLLDQLDLVVVSPGVPAKSIPIRYAERAGAEVIGEVELASRYLKGRIVAITGSNGKTTTTSLIGELLRDAGLQMQVGGNIGRPLISMVESSRDDGWTVVEMSSFQLETIKEFHPTVAVVLNVTPNHMDRYETFTDYAAAKHRIFMNQTPGDVAVLNADDEIVSQLGERLAGASDSVQRQTGSGRRSFSARPRNCFRAPRWRAGVAERRRDETARPAQRRECCWRRLPPGLLAAPLPNRCARRVKRFDPVEHRLEFVAELTA